MLEKIAINTQEIKIYQEIQDFLFQCEFEQIPEKNATLVKPPSNLTLPKKDSPLWHIDNSDIIIEELLPRHLEQLKKELQSFIIQEIDHVIDELRNFGENEIIPKYTHFEKSRLRGLLKQAQESNTSISLAS